MTNTIFTTPMRRFAALTLFLAFIAACASTQQSELDHGKALISAGRVKEGYARLSDLRSKNPGNAEIERAYQGAVARYADVLASQADDARTQQRWSDAERAYNELANLPGQAQRAKRGLDSVAEARKNPGAPAALISTPAALPAAAPVPAPAAPAPGVAAATVSAVAPATPVVQPAPAAVRSPQAEIAATIAPPAAAVPAQPVASAAPAQTAQPAPRAESRSAPAARPAASAASNNDTSPPPRATRMEDGMKAKISLQFKDASVRSLFDIIAKTSGVNVIIDKDVSHDLKTSVFLKDTTVEAAIEKILMTSQLSQRKLDENTLLIYPDDPNKQHDYRERVMRAFYLKNVDAKTMANTLRMMVRAKDLIVDDKLNMILMRDTVEAIRMAEKVVALQDVDTPEVMLEVEILEVNSSLVRNLGVEWPASGSIFPVIPRTGDYVAGAPIPFSQIRAGGAAGPLALRAQDVDSDINVLANPRIRAKNREKAKILIGQRVPTVSTNTNNNTVSENITYLDVGLKLEFESQVYAGDEVSIKIGLEVSQVDKEVATSSGGRAYEISTRTANTVLRLKNGENQVLAGLIRDEDRKINTRIPGLGAIPILGKLFGADNDKKEKREIVLSITPRLVRGIQAQPREVSEFSMGTDASLRGRNPDGFNAIPAPLSTGSSTPDNGEDASERRTNQRRPPRDEED